MAKPPDIKRIKKEDFENQYQTLVDRLAFPLNSFMEQVRSAFNKNINFENLNQEIVVVDLTVDENGIPTTTIRYKSNLSTRIAGNICINTFNLTDNAVNPLGQPFINFSQSDKLVQVNHVTGLQANNRYRLIVLSIGS